MSNTNDNWHEYEIQWTPESITWLVDGKVGRTQKKSDTWNATANQWNYPQSPSRVQLSIWPGGASSNAEGTINWAGGPIDWKSSDIVADGYYYASVGEVTIDCYQTTSAPGTNSGKSYTFSSALGTNNTVIDGTKSTVLKSLLGTGLDMNKDYPSSSAVQTVAQVIPGLTGGGPGTNGQAAGDSNSGSGSSGSGTSGGGTTGTGSTPSKCTSGSFQQDCGSATGTGTTSEGVRQERVLGASAFAALVAVVGMLWL